VITSKPSRISQRYLLRPAQLPELEPEHGKTRSLGGLTPFERRLLELLAAGMTRTEIGILLHISPRTVTHALTVAKEKIGARTLTEAAVRLSREVVP